MTWQRIALVAVLAVFLTDTALVLAEHGMGFFELAMANTATQLMSFDLTISLTLIAIWMAIDARKRGRSAIPYIVLMLLTGAAGPLVYLIVHDCVHRVWH